MTPPVAIGKRPHAGPVSHTPRGRVPGRQAVLLAAAGLLAAGWLAPGLTWQRPRVHQVVVIDITQSMNVVDQTLAGPPGSEPPLAGPGLPSSLPTPSPAPSPALSPALSRLAAVKQALRQTLDSLPCGSRLGWAIFTDNRSYLLSLPLEVCAHRAELRDTLAQIDGRMAWSGNSEVAKGLHSAIDIARQLPGRPAIVFITDGHEAPPLSPRHRPRFDDRPGEVAGVIVGVGGAVPQAIPKTDSLGRPLGLWGGNEVLQTDPRSQGRGASVGGEAMADDAAADPPTDVGLGATPGAEHLSSLREPYLQLLARENGLAYHRLQQPEALATALGAPGLAQPVDVPLPGRNVLGALALALLLWRAARPGDRRGAG